MEPNLVKSVHSMRNAWNGRESSEEATEPPAPMKKIVSNVQYESSEEALCVQTFEKMGLREELLREIYAENIDTPSEFQKRVIPAMLNGRDIIAEYQSGTGKTLAFSVAILQTVDPQLKETQVLILSSTKMRSNKSQQEVYRLGSYKIKTHSCVGGGNFANDIKKLENRPLVVTGKPDCVLEMIRRKHLDCHRIKILVLDEADKMYEKGFKSSLAEIIDRIPRRIQIASFSTKPQEFPNTTDEFLTEPVIILEKSEELSLIGVNQSFVVVERKDLKFDTLITILGLLPPGALIFCNSKKRVDWLVTKMKEAKYKVSGISREIAKKERDRAIMEFETGKIKFLVSTDVLMSKMNTPKVEMIINYDLPNSRELYIHRVGVYTKFPRVKVVNVVIEDEVKCVKGLEKYYGTKIDQWKFSLDD